MRFLLRFTNGVLDIFPRGSETWLGLACLGHGGGQPPQGLAFDQDLHLAEQLAQGIDVGVDRRWF